MDVDLKIIMDVLNILAAATVVFGVPTAFYNFFKKLKNEKRQKEFHAYDASNEAYVEYLKLCFQNPRLDIFDIPDEKPIALSPVEKKQELTAFTILFAVFERCHNVYLNSTEDSKELEWLDGWDKYIQEFFSRKNFRDAWSISGRQFNKIFQEYMQEYYHRFESNQ